jgi:hypothetical protein
LIGLSRAAAVTSTINLGTGVALVPERHPVLAAKEIASLDHYSKGRFIYGIGAGWNEAECTMMGGDFAHRWAQVKEYILAMKSLWTGEYASAEGKYANFPSAVCRPTPWRTTTAARPSDSHAPGGGAPRHSSPFSPCSVRGSWPDSRMTIRQESRPTRCSVPTSATGCCGSSPPRRSC